ncbi:MAG TPA: hypothetical protein VFE32_21895 [Puia sp.]|nr:hypothetical protein [Puia sp.]
MKKLFLPLVVFAQVSALGQKAAFFDGISLDSSYTVIGMTQGYGKTVDSMERFWFLLDNPKDMKQLQREWVFKDRVGLPGLGFVAFDVYVIQGKRLTGKTGLIVPQWSMATTGSGSWYRFDTASLIALHRQHPFHYHSEHMAFKSFPEYAAYGNSQLDNPKLLFFFEPDMRYEGGFEIISGRTSDPSSPLFVARDINKELEALAPKGSYQVQEVENDSFNISHRDRVKIQVHCSKALYERYEATGREKGPWRPMPIEITLFWRDDQ